MNNIDLVDYVLMNLNNEEKEKLSKAVENASDAIIEIITNNCQSAMNLYN